MKTTKFNFGDIILISFPFSNLTSFKKRPCLVLKEHQQDVLVVFISSQFKQRSTDDILVKKDNINNLVVDSLIKVWKINVLHKGLIIKKIGNLDKGNKIVLKNQLVNFFSRL
jgi:mRNA interferase MazF